MNDKEAFDSQELFETAAMSVITALNAAIVNIRMYPPMSEIISNSITDCQNAVRNALEKSPALMIGEANNQLIINSKPLNERYSKRHAAVSITNILREREIASVSFERGVAAEEIRELLDVVALEDKTITGVGIVEKLSGKTNRHITVNERRFVSIDGKEELVQEKVQEEERDDALKPEEYSEQDIERLKESIVNQRFTDYLKGLIEAVETKQDIEHVVLEPGRAGNLLRETVREEISEAPDTAEVISLLLTINNRFVEGISLCEKADSDALTEEIYITFSLLDADEIKELLIAHARETIDQSFDRARLLNTLRKSRVLMLLDLLITEHQKKFEETEEDEPARKRKEAVSSLIDEIFLISKDKSYEQDVSDRIYEADMWKKLMDSHRSGRDTGSSSAILFQMSELLMQEGIPLDVDVYETKKSFEENIPKILKRLYETHKDEAANKLIEIMLDNLNDISPEIRLKSAQAVSMLPEMNKLLSQKGNRRLAQTLTQRLIERLELEKGITEIYSQIALTLGELAEGFLLMEEYDSAVTIVDTLWKHRSDNSNRKPEQQEIAYDTISSIASNEVLDKLKTQLLEGDPEEISQISNMLVRFDMKSVKPLIDVLKTTEDIRVKSVTFDSLEIIGKDAILDLINDLEKHNPWHMYRNIISILAEIGNKSTIGSLSRFLTHQNNEVRLETVKALSNIRSPETVEMLIKALGDKDESVRIEACLALGRLRDVSTVPVLTGILKAGFLSRKSIRLKSAAVKALGDIGDQTAIPALESAALKRSFLWPSAAKRELKVEAIRAITKIGNPHAGEALINIAKKVDGELFAEAERGMRRIKK